VPYTFGKHSKEPEMPSSEMRTVPIEWPEFPDHGNNLWSGRRNYHKVIKWAGP